MRILRSSNKNDTQYERKFDEADIKNAALYIEKCSTSENRDLIIRYVENATGKEEFSLIYLKKIVALFRPALVPHLSQEGATLILNALRDNRKDPNDGSTFKDRLLEEVQNIKQEEAKYLQDRISSAPSPTRQGSPSTDLEGDAPKRDSPSTSRKARS